MVHVGLDLSRTRLDVHVMDESGAPLAVTTALPEAIWHMLSTNKPFAPAGAALSLAS